ncbi:hypothetical protein Nepgr_032272 [Nepenthes gracilis]|uniref:Uncharacterized protein n=1 Tax=Nepenthes gracilis TaxID=150966 RepID=A0AAD3TJN3_NEPGR|nr:hypothetical protein Nepgr_032272 [Nepenthes gracilis]
MVGLNCLNHGSEAADAFLQPVDVCMPAERFHDAVIDKHRAALLKMGSQCCLLTCKGRWPEGGYGCAVFNYNLVGAAGCWCWRKRYAYWGRGWALTNFWSIPSPGVLLAEFGSCCFAMVYSGPDSADCMAKGMLLMVSAILISRMPFGCCECGEWVLFAGAVDM